LQLPVSAEPCTIGKIHEDTLEFSVYTDAQTNTPTWRIQMNAQPEMKVEIKEMPELNVD